MNGIVIGIDNGVSGAIAVAWPSGKYTLKPTPTKVEQNYQKKAKNVTRIDHVQLGVLLSEIKAFAATFPGDECLRIVMEKPFVNPGNFVATSSSLRAMEATLVVVEQLGLGYQFLDAKEWQKRMLPEGTKTRPLLKKASKELGIRTFPDLTDAIVKIKDADAVWIAEYARKFL